MGIDRFGNPASSAMTGIEKLQQFDKATSEVAQSNGRKYVQITEQGKVSVTDDRASSDLSKVSKLFQEAINQTLGTHSIHLEKSDPKPILANIQASVQRTIDQHDKKIGVVFRKMFDLQGAEADAAYRQGLVGMTAQVDQGLTGIGLVEEALRDYEANQEPRYDAGSSTKTPKSQEAGEASLEEDSQDSSKSQ